MFGKKTCGRCNKKVESKYSFCPHCGNPIAKKKEDYGMLGINDDIPRIENGFESLFDGLGSGIFNKMISGTIKMIEKELEKELKNQKNPENPFSSDLNKPTRTNFEIIINGKKINPANIKFSQRISPNALIPNQISPKKEHRQRKTTNTSMSPESIKKMSKLPKEEPTTNIRRLSNKVIYEIDIPGVKSTNDISIIKLENSIEVKALAKDKAYSKLIPIDLPILNYELSKGKLTLELDAKN